MRRCGPETGPVISVYDHEMAVFDAWVHDYGRLVVHDGPEILDEDAGLLRGDVGRTVVLHDMTAVPGRYGHQVDPECGIVRPEINAHAHGLDRRPACITRTRIETEHCHVRHIASRGEPLLDGPCHAQFTPRGKAVHDGDMSDLEGGLSTEFPDGFVGHAVTEQDNGLHVYVLRVSGVGTHTGSSSQEGAFLRFLSSTRMTTGVPLTSVSLAMACTAFLTFDSLASWVSITTGTNAPFSGAF